MDGEEHQGGLTWGDVFLHGVAMFLIDLPILWFTYGILLGITPQHAPFFVRALFVVIVYSHFKKVYLVRG